MLVVVYSRISASAALDQIQPPIFAGQAQPLAAKKELLQVPPVLSLEGLGTYIPFSHCLLKSATSPEEGMKWRF